MFEHIHEWRNHVIENWQDLRINSEGIGFETIIETLLAISFIPALPNSLSEVSRLLEIIQEERYTESFAHRLHILYDSVNFEDITVGYLVRYVTGSAKSKPEELAGIERLIIATGALAGSQRANHKFANHALHDLKNLTSKASAIRVQAEMINAGHDVIIAGHDVNIVSKYYGGNKASLRSYLGRLRAVWNQPDLGRILPGHDTQSGSTIKLHQLYTAVDVWGDVIYQQTNGQSLTEIRYSIIDEEQIEDNPNSIRIPVFEAIASKPYMVITGAAGTGKSSLARYIAISLAYACDPDSETSEDVNGLDLLGSAWIQGALLPLYVSLRYFAADDTFPSNLRQASASNLLSYLRNTTDSLAQELENYLTNTEVPLHGAFLILDGLDEVYSDNKRVILQKIIDQWVVAYPKCRILVTSRNHAYRQGAKWRLSERFITAELAPYNWDQMQLYVYNWYRQAAAFRPAAFGGGRETAEKQATEMFEDLVRSIYNKRAILWPLAKQPLLLALLTLIHEANKRLPDRKAKLYEETVELLNRWNPPVDGDHHAESLANLNLEKVRAALQLIAFDLQRDRRLEERYPSTINKNMLVNKLQYQSSRAELGAPVDLTAEYLETRNGILISDEEGIYRFPHLSIQEYLAGCALIEQYDECVMPEDVEQPEEGWTFPVNIEKLILHDPNRWRDVALFIGSILASPKDQDRRWTLIEALLPREKDILNEYEKDHQALSTEVLFSIHIAADIWNEVTLDRRRMSHDTIEDHLKRCLEAIRADSRLDPRERSQAGTILGNLEAS